MFYRDLDLEKAGYDTGHAVGYTAGYPVGFIKGLFEALKARIKSLINFFKSKDVPNRAKILKILIVMFNAVDKALLLFLARGGVRLIKRVKDNLKLADALGEKVAELSSAATAVAIILSLTNVIRKIIKNIIRTLNSIIEKIISREQNITRDSIGFIGDSRPRAIRYRDIIRRVNADPKDIRYAMHVAKNYQNAISGQKKQNFKQKYEKILSTKKELLNKLRNSVNTGKSGNTVSTSNPASTGRKIPFTMIIGGTALAVIIGLVVKKIRNAIKGNAELKKNAQQNDTDPRYIEFVENQMRTGQYNEPAIVNSVKVQIVPILEKDVMSKYNSGAITDQEYRDSKMKIENIKRANTLEDIYAEIKMPEIKREIVAYRTAKSNIERELAVLQQFAVRNQMSPSYA